MDPELLPGSGSGTRKIQSWIRNKSFRIHNTAYSCPLWTNMLDLSREIVSLSLLTLHIRLRVDRSCLLRNPFWRDISLYTGWPNRSFSLAAPPKFSLKGSTPLWWIRILKFAPIWVRIRAFTHSYIIN